MELFESFELFELFKLFKLFELFELFELLELFFTRHSQRLFCAFVERWCKATRPSGLNSAVKLGLYTRLYIILCNTI